MSQHRGGKICVPKQRRRSISIRTIVHDRLMYYVKHSDPALEITGSNVTEALLTRMLDAAGVPADVPPHRPGLTKPPGKPDRRADDPIEPAHFTF